MEYNYLTILGFYQLVAILGASISFFVLLGLFGVLRLLGSYFIPYFLSVRGFPALKIDQSLRQVENNPTMLWKEVGEITDVVNNIKCAGKKNGLYKHLANYYLDYLADALDSVTVEIAGPKHLKAVYEFQSPLKESIKELRRNIWLRAENGIFDSLVSIFALTNKQRISPKKPVLEIRKNLSNDLNEVLSLTTENPEGLGEIMINFLHKWKQQMRTQREDEDVCFVIDSMCSHYTDFLRSFPSKNIHAEEQVKDIREPLSTLSEALKEDADSKMFLSLVFTKRSIDQHLPVPSSFTSRIVFHRLSSSELYAMNSRQIAWRARTQVMLYWRKQWGF